MSASVPHFCFATQLGAQPGAGEGPKSLRFAQRQPQDLGCLFHREAHEIAQFDHLRRERFLQRETFEGLMNGQQFIRRSGGNEPRLPIRVGLGEAPPFARPPAAGPVDQDAPHRFGGDGEEMATVLPTLVLIGRQTQPDFMNQGGGLKCLAGPLPRQPGGSQLSQFGIDQRQQFFCGLGIAFRSGLERVSQANAGYPKTARCAIQLSGQKSARNRPGVDGGTRFRPSSPPSRRDYPTAPR